MPSKPKAAKAKRPQPKPAASPEPVKAPAPPDDWQRIPESPADVQALAAGLRRLAVGLLPGPADAATRLQAVDVQRLANRAGVPLTLARSVRGPGVTAWRQRPAESADEQARVALLRRCGRLLDEIAGGTVPAGASDLLREMADALEPEKAVGDTPDLLDLKILEELHAVAMHIDPLSEKVQCSPRACGERVRAMTAAGLLTRKSERGPLMLTDDGRENLARRRA
jgi:hypothetical protein